MKTVPDHYGFAEAEADFTSGRTESGVPGHEATSPADIPRVTVDPPDAFAKPSTSVFGPETGGVMQYRPIAKPVIDIAKHIAPGIQQRDPVYKNPATKSIDEKIAALSTELERVMAKSDTMTPAETVKALRVIIESSKEIHAEIVTQFGSGSSNRKDVMDRLHTVRFTTSRAAANIWKGLTPEGRQELKGDIKAVLRETPPINNAVKKEHFRYDKELGRYVLPNGKIHPGKALGLEKQRLGWKGASRDERDRLRMVMAKVQAVRTAPPEEKREIAKKVAQEKAGQGETMRSAPMQGLSFGQVDPLSAYLIDAEKRFRDGSVEEQVAILDKTRNIYVAQDAVAKGNAPASFLTEVVNLPEDVKKDNTMLYVGLAAGAVIVGAGLYFMFKK